MNNKCSNTHKELCAVCRKDCCGSYECFECLDNHITCVIRAQGSKIASMLYQEALQLKMNKEGMPQPLAPKKQAKMCQRCESKGLDHICTDDKTEETWYVISRIKTKAV